MLRILIAPDKFKGSLTARQAANAMRDGFAAVFPDADIECVPVADGGEGMLDAFEATLGGEIRPVTTLDALGREVDAGFLLCEGGRLAVVESSQANGLWRIAPAARDPARTDTRGVGILIQAAIAAGAARIVVGLGGSGTNDCGVGLARQLGFAFTDDDGLPVTGGPLDFHRIRAVARPSDWRPPPVVAACDVRNPLLGPRGATRVYGPQKGLRPEDTEAVEEGHRRVAQAVAASFGRDLADTPGAGAAGGLGFGLLAFCDATLASGFDCLAQAAGLDEKIRRASLVVTGEGCLDAQTLEGKAPAGVAALARRHRVPVAAIAGTLDDPDDRLSSIFDAVATLVPGPITLDDACRDAAAFLERAARRLARTLATRIP